MNIFEGLTNEGSSLKLLQSGLLVFFFNLRKNKTISTKRSMQTFLPLKKKHFPDFFFYHDSQFFETGPRLSTM